MAIMRNDRAIGILAFVVFVGCVPAANWIIHNIGTNCVPNGPCLIPVAPGILAPSGVLLIGVAFVFRDFVQRLLGMYFSLAAIAVGTLLSLIVSPPQLVIASTAAFVFSETADFLIYTPLQKRNFVFAVFSSGVVGSVIDSLLFVWLAFGSIDYFVGQTIGKMLMVALTIPFLVISRSVIKKPVV